MTGIAPGYRLAREQDTLVLTVAGDWTIATIDPLSNALQAIDPHGVGRARIDVSRLGALDTAGAWTLHRFARRLERGGLAVAIEGASYDQAALIKRMEAGDEKRQSLARPFVSPLRLLIERMGRAAIDIAVEGRDLVEFFGHTIVTLARTIHRPRRLRAIALLSHVERIGLDAMPIIGLLAFLIGVVLAYQGAQQLRDFGAEIYTINLLGVSVLREIGVLLTAILVAGRSGSAFTAEIGTMQVNEEVDALTTLGLDPMEVLVLPRLAAMMIALPLVVFFANMMALFGGAVMSMLVLEVSLAQFLEQLLDALTPSTFWVGMVKAPVFAFLIAMVGCYEGLKVGGSAESVGRMTTKSVVESIFLVIVADAIFSMLFSMIGV
jgi:phospholipid/cholesterol/gamma-HCH transport system permease protein